MVIRRQGTFWIAVLAVFIALFWLLREIMLPFVAGLVLAYLLDPLANRLAVVAVCIVCQFLEGYVLAPILVGRVIGLHPVWLMFALFASGYLLGFVGLLIAIPLAAAIAVLVRFALRQYLASPVYTGEVMSRQP